MLQVSAKTVVSDVSHVLTTLPARDRVKAVLWARGSER